jgi:hypothetical protein
MLVEFAPTHCGAGHLLGGHQVLVGWSGCVCPNAGELRGHRTYQCREPGCGHMTYDPPCTDPREQTGRAYGR